MKKLFLVVLFFGTLLSAQNVWLNELHYDNTSTDEGEFIEIVLENAGSYTLSDFTVTLYNGNGGSSYSSETLENFTVGNTSDNFSLYTWLPSSIQNGEPDGIAIDYQGTLIGGQFLSYEGTFEAVDGSAAGVTSTDIGVVEGSTTLIGESLQLLGTGAVYSDFIWQDPATETPGDLNNGQTFGGTPEPTIIVASPNGGEQWEQGSTHPITWTSMNFTGNIKIELEMVYRDREVLVASTEDDGIWEWEIPEDLTISDYYSIIISDADDGDPWDDSNAAFSIIEPIPVTPYTIYEIQYSTTGPSPHEGELVETSGVVTAIFENYFFIQDGVGAWNGIVIYPIQEVEVGDEIIISGTVLEYNDKTEITDIISMTISGTTNLPEPVLISAAELSSTEDYESVLTKIQNVTVTNEDLGYGNWEVEDQSGACIIGGLGDYTYVPVLDDFIYSITGVVDYTYGDFKLEPRDDDDINLLGLAIEPLELNFVTIENCLDGLEFTISNLSNSAIEIINIEDTGMFPISENPWDIEDFNLTLPYFIESGEVLTFNVIVYLTTGNSREIVSDILEIESELGITEITLNYDTDVNSDAEDNLITVSSELIGNYPNPFNPSTTIYFDLNTENTEDAELIIYNLKGQKIQQYPIFNDQSSITWFGTDELGKPVTSGVYLYELKTGERSYTKKMLLLK
jgi:hypothetical protein